MIRPPYGNPQPGSLRWAADRILALLEREEQER